MTIDLEPCPFCGCQPAVSSYDGGEGDTKWAVACDCSEAPEDQPYAERYINVHGETRAEAVRAWNTRAPSASPTEAPKGRAASAAKGEGAITWADLEDEISDAIGDSMDMNWTYRDGAKAIIRALSEIYPNAALQPSSAADAKPVADPSEQTVRVLAEAHNTIRSGAPGLSDQTCNVLAGIIARKVSIIYAQPQPSQQADPRLIEWGYADLEEAIVDLGRLIEDRDAFDGLASRRGGPEGEFDREPDLGASSPEPSLRRLVTRYYRDHDMPEPERMADQYFAALQTPEARG